MNTLSPRSVTASHTPHTSCQASLFGFISIVSGFLLAMLILISGCVTTSPVDRYAKTLTSTVATVDAAMQSFATLVVLGQISEHDQANVRTLYTNYQAAEFVAEVALKHTLETHDGSGLTLSLETLRAAQLPLLQFLARFTTSPP